MSGIFGFVARGGTIDAKESVDRMLSIATRFSHSGVQICSVAPGVCFSRVFRTAAVERGETTAPWRDGNWAFVAEARLDEPQAVANELRVVKKPPEDDARLLGKTFRQAHAEHDDRILGKAFGDWILAAWNAESRRLYLAREPVGFTPLYYVETTLGFAFASTVSALLALPGFSRDIDEMTLARAMTGFNGAKTDNSTIFPAIHYLPPGQILCLSEHQPNRRRYFRMEEAIHYTRPGYDEAAMQMREHIDKAVARRLRGVSRIAATLSSGLDSTGIVACAARQLTLKQYNLDTYCAAPLYPELCVTPAGRIGDESPLARAFADSLPNVDFHTVDGSTISPIQGIEKTIDMMARPVYATSNDYWLHALYGQAAADGNSVVLNGGLGNITMSYGYLAHQNTLSLLRHGHVRHVASRTKQALLSASRSLLRRKPSQDGLHWATYSCISPAFAERIDLATTMHEHQRDPLSLRQRFADSHAERLEWFAPLHGSNIFQDMLSRVHGVDILDPSADSQLALFALGLPARKFNGPKQQPRWLYREAMKDRLPDYILQARVRGYQSADLNARLRADAERMDDLIARLKEHAYASEIINTGRLEIIWQQVKYKTSIKSQTDAWNILLNGVAVGVFLLRFS